MAVNCSACKFPEMGYAHTCCDTAPSPFPSTPPDPDEVLAIVRESLDAIAQAPTDAAIIDGVTESLGGALLAMWDYCEGNYILDPLDTSGGVIYYAAMTNTTKLNETTHRVYHGTTILGAAAVLRDGLRHGEHGHVYVTDSAALAARYANAQVTRFVDPAASSLRPHAAILVFETPAAVAWLRRDEAHPTLDTCEAIAHVSDLRLVEVVVALDSYDEDCARRGCEGAERQTHSAGCYACATRTVLADPRTAKVA